MEIFKIIETLQIYSEEFIAYKLDGGFANAVTEAVSLLISQGEQITDLQNELRKAREAQRWIPVTERLPDEHGTFIVAIYVRSRRKKYSDSAVFDPVVKRWRTHTFWGKGMKVTHWMPLPEPPKEVAHDE